MRAIAPVATVLMEVTLGNHRQADFDRFERAIRDIPEIVACWSVGGGVDYVLKVMARDIDAYQRLVDALLEREIGIDRYFTYIVTKTVKDETVLPLEILVPQPDEPVDDLSRNRPQTRQSLCAATPERSLSPASTP